MVFFAISRLFRGTRRHCVSRRHYAQQAMKDSKPIDATEMQQKQLLTRAARTRTRGSRLLPAESFNARKAYFVDKDKGLLAKKPKKATKKPMDPMAMMDGMKGNMLYMAPTRRLFSRFPNFNFVKMASPWSRVTATPSMWL